MVRLLDGAPRGTTLAQSGEEEEMDEIVAKLVDKVGLDPDTAKKVVDFLKEHADEVPGWLAKAGLKDKLPGGLGKLI